jgi:hypothetical protein
MVPASAALARILLCCVTPRLHALALLTPAPTARAKLARPRFYSGRSAFARSCCHSSRHTASTALRSAPALAHAFQRCSCHLSSGRPALALQCAACRSLSHATPRRAPPAPVRHRAHAIALHRRFPLHLSCSGVALPRAHPRLSPCRTCSCEPLLLSARQHTSTCPRTRAYLRHQSLFPSRANTCCRSPGDRPSPPSPGLPPLDRRLPSHYATRRSGSSTTPRGSALGATRSRAVRHRQPAPHAPARRSASASATARTSHCSRLLRRARACLHACRLRRPCAARARTSPEPPPARLLRAHAVCRTAGPLLACAEPVEEEREMELVE